MEELRDAPALGGLGPVIRGPVLFRLLLLRGELDLARLDVHGALPREPEQDRLLVFAPLAARLEVGTRARLLDDVHEVRGHVGIRRLRRDDVAPAE